MSLKNGYPDVVYFVKDSEQNEELKYSLRSLKNLNHGTVFIAGYKPSWVDGSVVHIAVEQNQDKYENVAAILQATLEDGRLSEDFILMNDDFFVLQVTDRIVPLRRMKPVDHYIELFSKVDAQSRYVENMKRARDLLRSWGHEQIDSYELHTPFLYNKAKLRDLISRLPKDQPLSHLRTIYGNYYQLGGERMVDVKVINDEQDISYNGQFLSTSDTSFVSGKAGDYIRKKLSKVLVFSHANDPDGLLSVVLAQLAFHRADYLLTNNPQAEILEYLATHNADDYDMVIICDIYPGRPVLVQLPEAYWFDHKQHSLNKISEHQLYLPNAKIEIERNHRQLSASGLLYEWLRDQKLIGDEAAGIVEQIRIHDTYDTN